MIPARWCLPMSPASATRERAVAAGADGLVLLTAGAGGQTGWLNPFVFVRAVRAFFDGPIVLAGGIGDGHALRAARALGCDLAYMGTKFIATRESMADVRYKEMLVGSSADDILLTTAFTGLQTNMLRPSITAAGLDPDDLPQRGAIDIGKDIDIGAREARPARWRDIWSAGHSTSGVTGSCWPSTIWSRAPLAEYRAAQSNTTAVIAGAQAISLHAAACRAMDCFACARNHALWLSFVASRRSINVPLTKFAPNNHPGAGAALPARAASPRRGCDMEFETFFAKTPATLDEIRTRVAYALERHPLCRSVQFDIVSTPAHPQGRQLDHQPAVGRARCAVGSIRYCRRHPGRLRSGRRGLISRLAAVACAAKFSAERRGGGTVKP